MCKQVSFLTSFLAALSKATFAAIRVAAGVPKPVRLKLSTEGARWEALQAVSVPWLAELLLVGFQCKVKLSEVSVLCESRLGEA